MDSLHWGGHGNSPIVILILPLSIPNGMTNGLGAGEGKRRERKGREMASQ